MPPRTEADRRHAAERAAKMHRPETVFAKQLRATRKDRGLTQTALAELMREAGYPTMSKDAIGRIEAGTQRVPLDEALAFAQLLNVSPAHLLSPSGDTYLAPIPTIGYSGDGVRDWLATGVGFQVLPEEIVTEDDRALAEHVRRVDLADRAELMARAYFGNFREADQFALELMRKARTWRVKLGTRPHEVINIEERRAQAMRNLEARASLGTPAAPMTNPSD